MPGRPRELIEHATEIRLRAEIRAGEILKAMADNGERAKAGDNQHGGSSAVRLPDLGITKSESSRWQQRAAMPSDKQEAMIARAKQAYSLPGAF